VEEALRALFTARFGGAQPSVAPLKGDGSSRRLWRLAAGPKTAIGVSNSDRQENTAFLEFSKHFRGAGLPVPEIYSEQLDRGFYLEEDLGDVTLFDFLSKRRGPGGVDPGVREVYKKVVSELPKFQLVAGRTLDYRFCYPRASFDRQSMMWDLNYFKYYFLRLAQIPFDEQALEDDFKKFADYLLGADRDYFLYRDFQSRNVMVRDGAPWFIDYQGGRRGALQYDVASLLYDAKADLPAEFREQLLGTYLDAASSYGTIDRKRFLDFYPGYVYIRIMQALGAYGLRGFYERKSHFLQSIPYAIRNIEQLQRTTELPVKLPALEEVFRRLVASSKLRQFGGVDLKLTVRVHSFSYKEGMPADDRGHGGGYVFDCRALPNPGRHEKYAKLTGRDVPVIEFLQKEPAVGEFLGHVFALIDQTVENYSKRNFTSLLVGFGCTGGQHRSVYCAERLAAHIRDKFAVEVKVDHLQQNGERPAA
jgi:aminoglycoside/choline kinase family phosphotransferase